jgi:hypothetical protein
MALRLRFTSSYWKLYNGTADVFKVDKTGGITFGIFNSTAGGYGLALDEVTNTAAFRVYADDGGAALTPTGSVGDVRAGIFRLLLTANQAAVNARTWGLMGQVKLYDATFNNEQLGGVCGRFEPVQSAGTLTLAGYGISSGVCGIIGSAGTTTVSANHVVAGVAAIADIKGTMTQTGKVCGVYVGKYDTTNWSDSTSRASWGYGLYVDEDAVTVCPIQVGKFVASAATGGGFAVTLTNSAAMRVYAEVSADLTSAATVRSILGRMLVSGDITSTAECFGVAGQCVVKNAKMQHDNAGVLGSFEVQTTAGTISGDIGDSVCAGMLGRVGVSVTGTTIEADGILAGVAAMSNITDGYVSITSGGILAAFYVGAFASTTKQDWGYGLFIEPSACTKAISVGKYASAVSNGMPLNGSTWNVGFFTDDAGAAQTASTVVRNVISRAYFSIDQTNAACDFDAIRGHIKAASGIDFSGDTSTRACVRGYLEMAGATVCGAGSFLSGLMGELWGDGNITGTGKVAGVMSRLYTSTGTTSGTTAAFMATKHFASTQEWPYGLYIDSATCDIRLANAAGAGIYSRTTSPNGALTAPKGSICLVSNGSGVNDRLWTNTDGGTTWTSVTCAA